MRYLLMLAAAASLAACAGRAEDEVGAAPDRGDTTAVVADTALGVPTDTTMGQRPGATDTSYVAEDTSYVAEDTTSMDAPAPTPGDSALTDHEVPDTTGTGTWTDTTGMGHDSTGMGHDSTDMSVPADSAAQPNQ